jgi:hypothetical protein
MRTAVICGWLVLAIGGALIGEDKKPCTQQDAINAEKRADSLKNWSAVYGAFEQFGQCGDQGAIGEGYSDSIARLLSSQGSTAEQLSQLTSHDRDFEQFVLRHVDELMTPDQAAAIRKNAESHCPSDAKRLCKSIVARIGALPAQ